MARTIRWVVLGVMLVFWVVPAAAEEPKMLVSFGGGILHASGGTVFGLYGGVARVIKETTKGSTAIVAGAKLIPNFSDRKVFSAGGGVSHTITVTTKLKVFVQGLVGFMRQGTETGNPLTPRTDFGFSLSGGIKAALTPKLTATVSIGPGFVKDQGELAKGLSLGFGLQVPIGR